MNESRAALVARLGSLQGAAVAGHRPPGKVADRWLGDFLDQSTPSGLLDTELDLLDACARGFACHLALGGSIPSGADKGRADALLAMVQRNVVRAGFLRFLALGGDENVPVHEAGIELHNAMVDGPLDLRGCKVVGRFILIDCFVHGDIKIEDASLGILVLRGTCLAGLLGNRAIITGSAFLDAGFCATGTVQLFSAQVGGSLVCSLSRFGAAVTCARASVGANVTFEDGVLTAPLEAQGLSVKGNLLLDRVVASQRLSMAAVAVGGSLRARAAQLGVAGPDAARWAIDLTGARIDGDLDCGPGAQAAPFQSVGGVLLDSATIGGRVDLGGAQITWAGDEAGGRFALGAQNATVGGSLWLNAGFSALGQVGLAGAAIAKDLVFSDGMFRDAPIAITAERARVAGSILCQKTDPAAGGAGFQSFGGVCLSGVQCAHVRADGGRFHDPGGVALDCSLADVAGSVILRNAGPQPFESQGEVSFYTARIGQHLDCSGGHFSNPGGKAINAEALKVAGCVFLGAGDDRDVALAGQQAPGFEADGETKFVGAEIDLQFNCQAGVFRNAVPDGKGHAAAALNLSASQVRDILFLGVVPPDQGSRAQPPPRIEGSLDLSAATVRGLADDGLVGGPGGLRPTVTDKEGKVLRCNLMLDLFAYERLIGPDAANVRKRRAWLAQQEPVTGAHPFQPGPYAQLVGVLRAMGHAGEADDIALAGLRAARRGGPRRWGFKRLLETVALDGFLGYGYRPGRALAILLLVAIGFSWFYAEAFRQGGIVPADGTVRADPAAAQCVNWSPASCPAMAGRVVPLFEPLIYSADVMLPVIGLGQKASWTPTHDKPLDFGLFGRWDRPTSVLYVLQLIETVLGWAGGLLLVSFAAGLIEKK